MDTSWKERLGFVTGNILVWSIVLLKLWPIASRFYIGKHMHALASPFTPVPTEEVLVRAMGGLLALGGTALTLSIIYIFFRGLWLAVDIESRQGQSPSALAQFLDRGCKHIFGSLLFLFFYIGILYLGILLLEFLSRSIEAFSQSVLSLSPNAAYWGGVGCAVLGLCIGGAIVWHRLKKSGKLSAIGETFTGFSGVSIALALLMLSIVIFITIEGCYTLDLEVNERVFARSRTDVVVIHVALGGATSDTDLASLRLLNSSRAEIDLKLHPTAEGEILSFVSPSTLSPGVYQVELTYPHASLSTSFPFVRPKARRSKSFLIIP